MARDATIAERPVPPKGRLSFPRLMLRLLGNPVASWGKEFYDEKVVRYRWLGRDSLFVMDPELIQEILLETSTTIRGNPSMTTCSARRSAAVCSIPKARIGAGSDGLQRHCSGREMCSLMCRLSLRPASL
jgi:hypothetical protein